MKTIVKQKKPKENKLPPLVRLGSIIRVARLRKGWAVMALGNEIGISGTTISEFERGRVCPRSWIIQKLVGALGLDWLEVKVILEEHLIDAAMRRASR